jgi:UDP-N-acetylglucosamine:LPS N-acetylglucosamine transferase
MVQTRDDTVSSGIKILAVASEGGHWEELMLLRPSLEIFDLSFATTDAGLATRNGLNHVYMIADSNRDQPFKALSSLFGAFRIIRRVRPDFVITTGALPGLFCIIAGRMMGAKTIWIDSIANSDKPSMSGYWAKWFSNLWLTQWEHLADKPGFEFSGALL